MANDRRTGPLTARVFNVEHPFIYVEVSAPMVSGADKDITWKESLGVALRLGDEAFLNLRDSDESTPPCLIVGVPGDAQHSLLPMMDRWQAEFVLKMERNTDFTREDEGMWQMDGKMVIVAWAAEILEHEDKNGKPGAYVWMRIHLTGSDTPVEDLESLLKALGYGYFRDEDASNGMFTRCNEAYCYISPEWRSGWFENHALPEGNGVAPRWKGEPCESEGA